MIEQLRQTPIFENLDNDELDFLQSISTKKTYHSGNILFYKGDTADKLFILLKGSLKIYMHNTKGNEIIIKFFNEVSLIAELANLEHIPYPANCEAIIDSEVLVVDFKKFEEYFLKDAKFLLVFVKSLTKKIMNLERVIESNIKLNATSKVAKYIYEKQEEFISKSNVEIARTLNITPETLSRIIKKFKKDEILKNESNKFFILDKEKLKEYFN